MKSIDVFNEHLTKVIRKLLSENKSYRDSDSQLISRIWQDQTHKELDKMSAREFMIKLLGDELINSESIRRTRAKIQENTPELRGDSYEERQYKAGKIRFEIIREEI
jgi:hypothetical protein